MILVGVRVSELGSLLKIASKEFGSLISSKDLGSWYTTSNSGQRQSNLEKVLSLCRILDLLSDRQQK